VFTFLLGPLFSFYSRRHEFEADAFAARNASAGALTRALVKLYQDNAATLTPDPLHSAFYDSHPPAAVRIARLNAFSPPEAATRSEPAGALS
jgi:STE24 endopeptidase